MYTEKFDKMANEYNNRYYRKTKMKLDNIYSRGYIDCVV